MGRQYYRNVVKQEGMTFFMLPSQLRNIKGGSKEILFELYVCAPLNHKKNLEERRDL